MKILSVSDHIKSILQQNSKDIKEFNGIDLILSCGDLAPEYLSSLAQRFNVPVYYVCGNHDIRFLSKHPPGCINLHNQIIRFNGINFLGLEGSKWYNGGHFQYTESQMRSIIKRLKMEIWRQGGIDIVVTHASPRHIHDAEDRCHQGFKSFRRLIEKYAPAYFLHGHTHAIFKDPSERITIFNETKVINCYEYYIFEVKMQKNKKESNQDKGSKERGIKSFKEAQEKEEAFKSKKPEIRNVSLTKIVGSVGRYLDFDGQFKLKKEIPKKRLEHIRELMKQGKHLPPIKLYQINDEYYVVDGNHRVAVANELGYDELKAQIIRFIPSKKELKNILFHEKSEFLDKTGLSDSIELTAVGQYAYLIKQISDHWRYMGQHKDVFISFEGAAIDWFKSIYKPLEVIIKKSNLVGTFPERNVSDLYVYITFHQWESGRKRRYGFGIDDLIPKNMEKFRQKVSKIEETDLPNIQQRITAFIFMNVKLGKGLRIMEKLFTLNEVTEIHSVAGEIDLIVKIRLRRNLLISDSELIGQFIYDHIRRIPGVIKTQTNITENSKEKNKS